MKKKNVLLLLVSLSLTLTGCGSLFETDVEKEMVEETEDLAALDNMFVDESDIYSKLEEGCYYVQHTNKTCEKLYFGNASFEAGTKTTSASTDRILWFKDDFDKIPNLYAGDKIIYYYTQSELTEEYVIERFMDLGLSIGVRGLEKTPSGRYKISTNVDNKTTYPGDETDKLLNLTNNNVIIDKIAGISVRSNEGNNNDELVSKYGTFVNLMPNEILETLVYNGTKEYRYNFKSNIRILGSMEVYKSTDYDFSEENVIEISMPVDFNEGYYCINGAGVFRYVYSNNFSADASNRDQFNIPNIESEDSIEGKMVATSSTSGVETKSQYKDLGEAVRNIDGKLVSMFNVKESQENDIIINITYSAKDKTDTSQLRMPTLVDPDKNKHSFIESSDGFYLSIDKGEAIPGEYRIEYKNAEKFNVNVSFRGLD